MDFFLNMESSFDLSKNGYKKTLKKKKKGYIAFLVPLKFMRRSCNLHNCILWALPVICGSKSIFHGCCSRSTEVTAKYFEYL